MISYSKENIEAIRSSGQFDEQWYLQQYPDVTALKMDPVEHYLWLGQRLNRSMSAVHSAETRLRAIPAMARGPQFDQDWSAVSRIYSDLLTNSVPNDQIPQHAIETARSILGSSSWKPLVSVIVPTWNRESTIITAIRSILDQSYSAHEIIISDDGSTDSTLHVVRQTFRPQCISGQIKIVENPHRGVSSARNAGLAVAEGNVFAYLDSDNTWRPDYLLLMASAFCESNLIQCVYSGLKSHNRKTGAIKYLATPFNRRRLLSSNFIDMNTFVHRRELYDQLGGFDENLTRLVDWDLIVRYSYISEPVFLRFCGVDYILDRDNLNNITFSQNLEKNYNRVARKNFQERVRLGLEKLRLAYFVYDYPAFSQTFVLNELRYLKANGFDVIVFYAVDPDVKATLDFEIEAIRIKDAADFADQLKKNGRNLCHSHFAYPGVTLFVRPACEIADINYTYMPHAVDIFHQANRERSKIESITNDERCLGVFVYGDHHRRYLESKGADRRKIFYNFQAIDQADFAPRLAATSRAEGRALGIVIGRFIEKKGIEYLLKAASELRDVDVRFKVYGYGPLLSVYRDEIAARQIHNVELCEPLDGKSALADAYAEADFLVVPSVEAANGDVDGFPTVIFEAIAAGIPVVATGVSAIPDYLRDGIEAIVVEPANSRSLADGIRRLCEMDANSRALLNRNARKFLELRAGVERTVGRFMDIWSGYKLDLFMVTYNTGKYDDRAETLEIVRRVLDQTTSCYRLTIVDNGSDGDFLEELETVIAGAPQVRLIRLGANILCGPASNIALRSGDSEFAIYLCSKEAFVAKHGWERPLVEYMRGHPELPLGGYQTHLPRHTLGSEIVSHPNFSTFRNPSFAYENPLRLFSHVQGGVYVIRRSALERYGFFNESLPQANMDVEYSYYLESCGAKIGKIPGIVSVSNKTRPHAAVAIGEDTLVVHPLTLDAARDLMDRLEADDRWQCNMCGMHHDVDVQRHSEPICSQCHSTAYGRKVLAQIAHDPRTQRGQTIALFSSDEGLAKVLSRGLFGSLIRLPSSQASWSEHLAGKSISLAILDASSIPNDAFGSRADELAHAMNLNGTIVLATDMDREAAFKEVLSRVSRAKLDWECADRTSRYLSLDNRPLWIGTYVST